MKKRKTKGRWKDLLQLYIFILLMFSFSLVGTPDKDEGKNHNNPKAHDENEKEIFVLFLYEEFTTLSWKFMSCLSFRGYRITELGTSATWGYAGSNLFVVGIIFALNNDLIYFILCEFQLNSIIFPFFLFFYRKLFIFLKISKLNSL